MKIGLCVVTKTFESNYTKGDVIRFINKKSRNAIEGKKSIYYNYNYEKDKNIPLVEVFGLGYIEIKDDNENNLYNNEKKDTESEIIKLINTKLRKHGF